MANLFASLKNTALLILLLTTSFYFAQINLVELQSVFAQKIEYIGLLGIIGMLLAAQFSRSRLVWLIVLLLIVYLANNSGLSAVSFSLIPETIKQYWQSIAGAAFNGLVKNVESKGIELAISKQAMLSGLVLLAALSCAKDRAILAFYSFIRIAVCLALISFVYGYFVAMESFGSYFAYLNKQDYPAIIGFVIGVYAELVLYLPIILCLLLMLKSSVAQASLTTSTILVTSLFWLAFCYNVITLPLGYCLIILFICLNLVVLVDSYYLAYRDELTGLPSRRALNQLSLSLGRNYTVAMIDIDHFKKFNDTYGHDVGDQVLRLVAAKLNKTRGGAKVFRYGGEEFTVVFSRKSAEHAFKHLEILRENIANYQMAIRQQQRKGKANNKGKRGKAASNVEKVTVTISIGVAQRASGQSFDKVVKAADQALYRAKENGRNQVCE